MRRIHAFELEDQTWLPRTIRDYATDFLRFMIELGDSYAPAIPVIRRGLECSGTDKVIDLGSGGGGPWPTLFERVRGEGGRLEVLLTDRYPNRDAAERVRRSARPGLTYYEAPVDAMATPGDLRGFRTMFTALHHFRPLEVRRILADAVANNEGIGAFEFSERSIRGVLLIFLAPLFVLLFTPFIRPFRWTRLVATYVVPVVPLVVLFDGTVSALRSYTIDELREIVDSLPSAGYAWEVGTLQGHAPIPVLYLIGCPVPPAGERAAAAAGCETEPIISRASHPAGTEG